MCPVKLGFALMMALAGTLIIFAATVGKVGKSHRILSMQHLKMVTEHIALEVCSHSNPT